MTAKTTQYDSPIGTFVGFLYFNEPDFKYKDGGEFKGDLRLTGSAALKMKAQVDAAVDAAFEDWLDGEAAKGKMPRPEREKWSKFYPYEEGLGSDGMPDGSVVFSLKQNATVTRWIKVEERSEVIGTVPSRSWLEMLLARCPA